jgi:hypothetical protein
MPSFCEYRNCHNLASSTYLGYCNQEHMDRGIKEDPEWSKKYLQMELFEMFELRDTKKLEPNPKPKPKEISKLQVRPLQKPSEK